MLNTASWKPSYFPERLKNKVNAIAQKTTKNLLNSASDLAYAVERFKHTYHLPALADSDRKIVDTLEREGVCVTSLEELAIPSTPLFLDATTRILPQMPKVSATNFLSDKHAIHAHPLQILHEYPELMRWGMEERILNIVENYLGVPVAYRDISIRQDLADGQQIGTRVWHRDTEDRRVLKIIVYLNDVTTAGGPFEYIPKSVMQALQKVDPYKYFSDEAMEDLVPSSLWQACTGSAGTVVFADVGSVYHRGRLPESARFTAFLSYNARNPRHPQRCQTYLPHPELFDFVKTLAPHLRPYILWNSDLVQEYQAYMGQAESLSPVKPGLSLEPASMS